MSRTSIVVCALALLASACASSDTATTAGGGSPSTPTPTQTRTSAGGQPVTLEGTVNDHGTEDLSAQGARVEVRIEADDVYFEPTFFETVAGASINVEIGNEGNLPHTFTNDAFDIDEVIDPGEKREITFELSAGEPMNFICRFHLEQGMQGAFFTDEGTNATTGGRGDGY